MERQRARKAYWRKKNENRKNNYDELNKKVASAFSRINELRDQIATMSREQAQSKYDAMTAWADDLEGQITNKQYEALYKCCTAFLVAYKIKTKVQLEKKEPHQKREELKEQLFNTIETIDDIRVLTQIDNLIKKATTANTEN